MCILYECVCSAISWPYNYNQKAMVDANPKDLRFRETSRLETTRRVIQHEFIKELTQAGFTFTQGEAEPRGIQGKVLRSVNEMYHGREKLKTNRQQVSDWVARVRKNNY